MTELLTPDQERELFARYRQSRDAKLEAQLVQSQIGLVYQLARRHLRRGVDLDELVQEGALGVLEAVRRFDPTRGARLPSYAAWWIRAYQWRYLMRNRRLVRIGTTVEQRRVFFRLGRARQALEAAGLDATPERIAARIDADAGVVRELMLRLEGGEPSLDALSHADRDRMLNADRSAASEPADELAARRELHDIVRGESARLRRELDRRRRAIFDARFGGAEQPSLEQLGRHLGITRERARQLEQGVLDTLRARVQARLGLAIA